MPKKKNNPKHMHFRQGKKVIVTLADGQQIVDRFIKLGRTKVELQENGHIDRLDIRRITDYDAKQIYNNQR
jgi:hypothetical protein